MLNEKIGIHSKIQKHRSSAKSHKECIKNLESNNRINAVCYDRKLKYHNEAYEWDLLQIHILNGKRDLLDNLIEEIRKDV
jgi:hypothetical protein